ncbi:MAG: outer membrane protein assembly factor BamB [Betaproteobacteria bacterium]|nr:MAG: outer membrane protein assembly factor BamB [Betaproteobacteria bacterium]
MTTRLAMAFCLLALAGCETVGGYYDSFFGGSGTGPKPTELQTISPTAEARISWQAAVGSAGGFAFAPAVAGGSVLAANGAGEVLKLELATGKLLWRVETGTGISAGPGTDGRIAVVGTPRGDVVTIDDSGRVAWKAQLSGEILANPAVSDGLVVVKSGDGRIYGLSAADGRRRWSYQRNLPALTVRSPAGLTVVHGGVFSGFPGGKLVALVLNTGVLAWEATVATPRGSTELERMTDIVGAPLVDERAVCAVAYQGRAGCFDVLKGTQIWIRDMSGIMPLAADNRYVYSTDERGNVHALDKATGASIWKQERLTGRSVTGPAAIGNYVAVGDYQGYVHFLNRADGGFAARIATDGSAIRLSPVATRDSVLVQTRNGGLFSISIR